MKTVDKLKEFATLVFFTWLAVATIVVVPVAIVALVVLMIESAERGEWGAVIVSAFFVPVLVALAARVAAFGIELMQVLFGKDET